MMDRIKPMLLRLRDCAFDDEAFLYEIKLDGIRIIADSREGEFVLYTRLGNDYSHEYEAINSELKKSFFGRKIVFDGEVVFLDVNGKPDFYELLRLRGKGRSNQLFYVIFDVLYVDGECIMGKELTERKAILDKLFEFCSSRQLKKADVYNSGLALFEAVRAANLEGIVAKRKDSIYLENARGEDWFKIKVRIMTEAFIIGYSTLKRSVCLALKRKDGTLFYAGNAGSGLTEPKFLRLKNALKAFVIDRESEFALSHKELYSKIDNSFVLVKPLLKLDISFLEFKENGRLRNPVIEKCEV